MMQPLDEAPHELQPYLICEPSSHGRCATWRLELEQQSAIALFLTEDTAAAYQKAAGLASGWKIVHPTRPQLAQLLAAALETGISLAVLDPDQSGAKRVFSLEAMRDAIQNELDA